MSPSDFAVDTAALTVLARSMLVLSIDMEQARSTVCAIDAEDFGHPTAANACTAFVHHWDYQADRLGDAVRTVGEKLAQTVKYYDDTDTGLSTQLRGMVTE